MNIIEYKLNAVRTMSYGWYLEEKNQPQLHAAIGMVTEFGELMIAVLNEKSIDKVNIMEEVGDVLWYLSEFQRKYNDLDWEDVEPSGYLSPKLMVEAGTIEAIEVLDMYKKHVFYGKPLKELKLKSELLFIYRMCVDLLRYAGYSVQDARRINIEKLRKRFPEKFTSDKAINRDVDSERTILEERK